MKRRSIVLAAMGVLLASSAAAGKPPITWVNGPVFAKSGPPPGRTSFLIHGSVDVSDFHDAFVHAFGGDAAAGQAYFATAFGECFSGARLLGEVPHGIQRDERHRLAWTAFPPDTTTWRISWVDSLNADSLRLSGADSLTTALARANTDWLIILDGLVATLSSGQPGMSQFTPSGGMSVVGGQAPEATVDARVVVLGGKPAAVVGYGRVSTWFETGRFRKTSVDDMVRWFALDLERALGKR